MVRGLRIFAAAMPNSSPSLYRDHRKWFIALVAILSIIIFYPLGNDNALYQGIANDLVYHGRVMYVGSWDHNFPGIVLFHTLSILLFGNTDMGYRTLDLAIQIIACSMLFAFWSRWLKPQAAFIAVMLYVFAYIRGSIDILGQRDAFGALFTLGAYHLLMRGSEEHDRPALRSLIFPGLLLGLAILIRPTFVIYAFIALAMLPRIRTIKHALTLLAIAAIPMGITLAGYAITGHLDDLYFAAIRFNADLYTTFSGTFVYFLFNTLYYPVPIVVLAVVGVLLWMMRKKTTEVFSHVPGRDIILLWSISTLVTVGLIILQGKYLSYHFVPLYLFCAPLAAIATSCLLRLLPERSRLVVFLLLGVFAAYPKKSLANVYRSITNVPGWEGVGPLDAFRINLSSRPMIGYEQEQAALRYLQLPKNKVDRIELIGFHHILKAHLAGASATRFNQLNSIGYRKDTARHFDESAFTQYQQRWRREYIDSLKSAKPGLIVVVRTSDSWYLKDPYNDVLHELPGYDSLIQAAYQPDTTIGGYEIFRRRDR